MDRGDGRDIYGRFTGRGGYGSSGEVLGLSEYERLAGNVVIAQHIRVTLPDGTSRLYDGLSPQSDGTFEGIEVKSGTASRNAQQRAFDDPVNSGTQARGRLNGVDIAISSVRVIRVP